MQTFRSPLRILRSLRIFQLRLRTVTKMILDIMDKLIEKVKTDPYCNVVEALVSAREQMSIQLEKTEYKTKHKPPKGFSCIRAVFTGRHGSCGFVHGKEYDLWIGRFCGRIYICRQGMNCVAIPYDTEFGFRKNWRVIQG